MALINNLINNKPLNLLKMSTVNKVITCVCCLMSQQSVRSESKIKVQLD